MTEIKVENIVATSSISDELDLMIVYHAFDDAKYEPDMFPGVVYRIPKPKTATLLFKSGNIVCTGAKSIEDLHEAVGKVIAILKKAGIKVIKNPNIKVQNIVASSDLHNDLNLSNIAIGFNLERVEYEPEQFPGLVYRLDDPKVVALLFGTGKVVITGAKRVEDIPKAVECIYKELDQAGLLEKR